ncbi:MAG: cupin domain-containing protein [Acidobacteriota bacterium]
MTAHILNIEDVSLQKWSHGDRFAFETAWVGLKLGSRKLGFNVTVVPPGKRAFPYHAHHGNEEMFFVLEGRGSIRIGGSTRAIRPGDFISLPPGRESAHQIINDSSSTLRYLAVSTMETPEVVEYPDSRKLGVLAGAPAGRSPTEDSIRHFTRMSDGVDYWEGEK